MLSTLQMKCKHRNCLCNKTKDVLVDRIILVPTCFPFQFGVVEIPNHSLLISYFGRVPKYFISLSNHDDVRKDVMLHWHKFVIPPTFLYFHTYLNSKASEISFIIQFCMYYPVKSKIVFVAFIFLSKYCLRGLCFI